jgi:hypothetical protein
MCCFLQEPPTLDLSNTDIDGCMGTVGELVDGITTIIEYVTDAI